MTSPNSIEELDGILSDFEAFCYSEDGERGVSFLSAKEKITKLIDSHGESMRREENEACAKVAEYYGIDGRVVANAIRELRSNI